MVQANRKMAVSGEALASEGRVVADLRRSAWDVTTIGASLMAAGFTFLFLMIAPTLCLMIFEDIWKDDAALDPITAYLLLIDLEQTVFLAAAGAGLFLLAVVLLQVWRHHRPFPAYRPILVALLIAWVWIIPEALARGGSIVSGGVIGTALALAFAIQWGLSVAFDRALD